ncbi:MAG: transposase [Ignavibacteria bacterium]|nr:transposase [Ignavibacteria bacterium]
MAYDPLKHHPPKRWRTGRQSIRLQGYDYSSEGSYYITVCTHNRECQLGDVVNDEMRLSRIGEIVWECWLEIPKHFSDVTLDEYQIMPNHVHGIVVIWGNHRRDLINQIPTGIHPAGFRTQTNWPLMKNPKQTLGKVIRHFKASASKIIHDRGFPEFGWQSRFHDHIIRSDEELDRIRQYIRNNPLNWSLDDENPVNRRSAAR